MYLSELLKNVDTSLYSEYLKERITEGYFKKPEVKLPTFRNPKTYRPPATLPGFEPDYLEVLEQVSSITDEDHKAKAFCTARKITALDRFYHCPRFMAWVNWILPDKFGEAALKYDEPRLIIPFWDENNKMFAFQGRSYKKDAEIKYITISIDGNPPIYGLDRADKSKMMLALEGPIDSMFVNNGIAFAGGAYSALDKICGDVTIVFDNEPRSEFTFKKIEKSIKAGYSVCIWPSYIKEKDVNDMIMGGMTGDEITKIIHDRTFKGLAAEMELKRWQQ
jgi:hypothetical protein